LVAWRPYSDHHLARADLALNASIRYDDERIRRSLIDHGGMTRAGMDKTLENGAALMPPLRFA
jgi:hypothetical protein